MATNKHTIAFHNLHRLRRARPFAFVIAMVTALLAYLARREEMGIVWPGGLLAAISIWIIGGIIIERLGQRTRCPQCDELFFQLPTRIGNPWTKQENCVACGFNLYRGENIEREL